MSFSSLRLILKTEKKNDKKVDECYIGERTLLEATTRGKQASKEASKPTTTFERAPVTPHQRSAKKSSIEYHSRQPNERTALQARNHTKQGSSTRVSLSAFSSSNTSRRSPREIACQNHYGRKRKIGWPSKINESMPNVAGCWGAFIGVVLQLQVSEGAWTEFVFSTGLSAARVLIWGVGCRSIDSEVWWWNSAFQ